jgi:hypothetical protein
VTIDVEGMTRPYFQYTQCPTRSPIRAFGDDIVGRDPGASREEHAKAGAAALKHDTEDVELIDLVKSLPVTPAVEIAIVWALLQERRLPPSSGPMTPASLLVQAELARICRCAADTLRKWGLLPRHRDDTAGLVWAFYAFPRITESCDCRDAACRFPAIHMIVNWLKPDTHTGRNGGRKSKYFALTSWLERACCGHSPPFKLVETFNQGLIAVAEPDLVAGKAAMRTCHCSQPPQIVAKGRTCQRCGIEPTGVISIRRKIVNKQYYVQERLQRCGNGQGDEHFFELLERHCPECSWKPKKRGPFAEQHQCTACLTYFPAFEATCPECCTRVRKTRGVVQAWVYRQPPSGFHHVRPTALQTIGLSEEASRLLMAAYAEGANQQIAVRRFVTALIVAPVAGNRFSDRTCLGWRGKRRARRSGASLLLDAFIR